MFFVHYRASTLGIQLEETLREMLNEGVIDINLADIIKKKFDKTMAIVLKKRLKTNRQCGEN